jgi:hypothetical protein
MPGAILSSPEDLELLGEFEAEHKTGILAGTIPVVSPESSLRIKYALAQELGLAMPEGMLSRVVEIIR